MKRIMLIPMAVGVFLIQMFTPSVSAAASGATVQATSNLNGTFPEPNPRNRDSGIIVCDSDEQAALVNDQITYNIPDTDHTVSGEVNVRVNVGTFKFYQELQAHGPYGIGMASILSGVFTDKAIVGFDDKSPNAGTIDIRPVLEGDVYDQQGDYNVMLNLNVTIVNSGSALAPKDLTYLIHQEVQFSNGGDSQNISGPSSITLTAGDVLTITATETLVGYIFANDDTARFTADFFNTTHLYLDSSTPGFTLTTDSGHDYRSPRSVVNDGDWLLYE